MNKMEKKYDFSGDSMITRSLKLLELLSEYPQGLTLQEIYTILNYPKSSTHKIVTILCEQGYLGKELCSLKYYLSRKLLMLGLSAVSSHDIIERSVEYMKLLRDKLGESVMIGALIDQEAILLNQVEGNLDFVFTLKQGMRFNLYSTAPGKVLLAYLPKNLKQEKINELKIDPANTYIIQDKSALKDELDKIKDMGYAVDINETVQGVHCIAAPIFDEKGEVIACVWTSGPAGRIPEVSIPAIAEKIIDCGLAISYNIGYDKDK